MFLLTATTAANVRPQLWARSRLALKAGVQDEAWTCPVISPNPAIECKLDFAIDVLAQTSLAEDFFGQVK